MSEALPMFVVPPERVDSDERFTPKWVFDALAVAFDLDPASPVGEYTHVPAGRVYTREDDGLSQPWFGFVWCNPPFSNATPWADKFIANGNGLWLGPVANSDWFQRIMRVSSGVWFMRDFPFVHPTHAGKRSSMPLALVGIGDRALAALTRAARVQPDAGTLMVRGNG